MKTIFLGLFLWSVSSLAGKEFGAKIELKDPVQIDKAIQSKPVGPILVEGKVEKVCEMKGCWMGIKSAQGPVRVTFKDYGFFVDQSLVGKKVLAEGVLAEKTLTLEESKHYAKDAGKDPKKVTQPVTEWTMVATGVRMAD